MIVIYLIFYVLIIYCLFLSQKKQTIILIALLIIITFLIGSRTKWPDQEVYVGAFNRAPLPWNFTLQTRPWGYVEKGYLFLASLIKMFTSNSQVYLFVMGGLSMFLLYKCLTKYSLLPLLGLAVYVARFLLNRDFQQMRSSLAILMIILAMDLIYKKKMWQYLLVIFVAYQFHHMALIGLPLYFFAQIKISRKVIYWSLPIAMFLSVSLSSGIADQVEAYSQDLQYQTYTMDQYAEGKGLKNPMIYFQVVILVIFTYFEEKFRPMNKYYDITRTGYFYSTLILILFSQYTALASRTSTMFATYEIFIIPMMFVAYKGLWRKILICLLGLTLTYFFARKYYDVKKIMKSDTVIIEKVK
jgi:hypothetical protein